MLEQNLANLNIFVYHLFLNVWFNLSYLNDSKNDWVIQNPRYMQLLIFFMLKFILKISGEM